MKKTFIKKVVNDGQPHLNYGLQGWIKSKRKGKKRIFIDLVDSTGHIQLIIEKEKIGESSFELARKIAVESAVRVKGDLIEDKNKKELIVTEFEIIAASTRHITPEPRSDFDIFDEKYVNQILNNKHIYIRNPKFMAIQRFRHLLLHYMRLWFHENNYIEIAAPVLTPVPLYHDKTAIPVKLHKQDLFLTQCVGYYLEAASMAFEKVYNISPSFRGEESKSKRHLQEYWHIKAEIAFGDLEDIIFIVESIIEFLIKKLQNEPEINEIFHSLKTKLCLDGLKTPFPRITYEDSIEFLNRNGCDIEFGDSIGSKEEEEILSKKFKSPFWLTGIPRKIEPFPYVIDGNDNRITRVADLIASNGYGELLGVAEKIHSIEMLDERLKEKQLADDKRFEWVRQVHKTGCVPHIAFGMGVERLIRWLMNIPHVRDAHPFPRTFGRKITV